MRLLTTALLALLLSNNLACTEAPDTGEPYPDLDEVPVNIRAYLADHLGPCENIWTLDFACSGEDLCSVFVVCEGDISDSLSMLRVSLDCEDPGVCTLAPPPW